MESYEEPRRFHVEVKPLECGDVAVVPAGELDNHSRPQLAEALRLASQLRRGSIVLDLQQVKLVDPSTLGLLVRAQKVLRAESREVAIVWGNPETRRPFEMTGLDRVFRGGCSYEQLGLDR